MNDLEIEVNKCCELLEQGKVILYPTDTIWGIGCDATNPKAVEKIFEIKDRSKGKSLIVLVDSIEMLKDYVKNFPPIAPDIIKAAKNPLSVIYSESKGLAKNVSADSTICIRVVDNEFCKALIHKLGRPITSTSANLAGDAAPSIYAEITEHIKSSVDYVVQMYHDVLTKPKASTIIRLYDDNSFDIIRQ
ncbi:MAG: threonylcarbamoyl-AMP synthase [Bacteroidales bacterium]|nr:threonylcarbamoyl-AMP synthase [Bacteroidales bacterium]MBR5780486.1 threonylcarbamoyl-AMP synthase [Bacteroidales bacterium]